jgi:hypothetical protein
MTTGDIKKEKGIIMKKELIEAYTTLLVKKR